MWDVAVLCVSERLVTCQNVNINCGCGCGTAHLIIIMQQMLANGAANNFDKLFSRNLKMKADDIQLPCLMYHLDPLVLCCG